MQEFLRSIPRNYVHVRNDFSELGIAGQQAALESLSDEMSVVSATAAVTVPYAQVGTTSAQLALSKLFIALSLNTACQILFKFAVKYRTNDKGD